MSDYQEVPAGMSGIIRTADAAVIPDDDGNTDWQTYQAWLAEGNTPDPAPPDPNQPPDTTTPEYQFALRSSWVQAWLDTTAQENYYADAARCVSYIASDNAVYAADAAAMSAWRDAVWPAFNAMPANWPADPAQWPLWDSIQPLLPQPADYGWAKHDPVGAPANGPNYYRASRL